MYVCIKICIRMEKRLEKIAPKCLSLAISDRTWTFLFMLVGGCEMFWMTMPYFNNQLGLFSSVIL